MKKMENLRRKLLLVVTAGTALVANACDSNNTTTQAQADTARYLGNIRHQLKP